MNLINAIPVITYDYIREGENKGKCSVMADGTEFKVIPFSNQGISSSAQELTLYNIAEIAKQTYPNGYTLPYFVDGNGYVFENKKQD